MCPSFYPAKPLLITHLPLEPKPAPEKVPFSSPAAMGPLQSFPEVGSDPQQSWHQAYSHRLCGL